jgi:IS30 family transposase
VFKLRRRKKIANSSGVLGAIQEQLRPLPSQGRQSITFDRGSEFMAWKTLHQSLDIKS